MGSLVGLENSALAEWVRLSTFGYPFVISVHAVGMSIMVGVALALDLRLLGLFPRLPLAGLHRFFGLAWAGFGINFLSGVALFSAQATSFAMDGPFQLKMALVLLGAATTGWSFPWDKDMVDQPSAKPQKSAAPPPPYSVPSTGREILPTPTTEKELFKAKDAAATLRNPVPARDSLTARMSSSCWRRRVAVNPLAIFNLGEWSVMTT